MDFIDYRKSLGLSFYDKDKKDLFVKRMSVFITSRIEFPFHEDDERDFAYMIGEKFLLGDYSTLDTTFEDPKGLQRAWPYLSKHTLNFADFLSCVVALVNTYTSTKTNKKIILTGVEKALQDCHIEYELLRDDDGIFIFPNGAKEFDDALISEPLEWLKKYPKARKTYIIALKQYADGVYIRDVADNLRKSLETFLQEFLSNRKNLENNKNEICKYLGEQGVDSGISGLFQPLINSYKNINDKTAKHNDEVDKKMLEFLLYQTGIMIRMIISVKNSEDE